MIPSKAFFGQFIRRAALLGLGLAYSLLPAQAQVVFSVPRNISNTGSAISPQMAVDNSGIINVVWQQCTPTNCDIFFSRGVVVGPPPK